MNKGKSGLLFKKALFYFNFLPFFALAAGYLSVESFVLPVNYFNYGGWGTLKVMYLKDLLSGYYYPRTRQVETEAGGNLANRTPWAVPKRVDFQIDEYGYRNPAGRKLAPRTVNLGDSFAHLALPSRKRFPGSWRENP
jgi:hypothetical protein